MTGLIKGLQPYNPSWKNHGTGGGTSFTLDVSSTTNATILIVGGVVQLAGTDYTVSGTTVTTTTTVTSGVEVISAVLYDLGSVTTPADGSVNFSSLGFTSQAQGALLVRGASSWARLPAGTSGQFLKTQGAGADVTWASAGGGWEFVSTLTASGTSFADFEGMTSGYDYHLSVYDYNAASDNTDLYLRFGTGGTPTYQSSDYSFVTYGTQGGAFTTDQSASASQCRLSPQGMGTGTNEVVHFELTIRNPSDSGSNTFMSGQGGGRHQSGGSSLGFNFSGNRQVDEAVTAVRIFQSGGTNISSGKFFFYKRANA